MRGVFTDGRVTLLRADDDLVSHAKALEHSKRAVLEFSQDYIFLRKSSRGDDDRELREKVHSNLPAFSADCRI